MHHIDCNVSERCGEKPGKESLTYYCEISIRNTLYAVRCNAYSSSVTVHKFICTGTSMCVGALSKGLRKALPISEKSKLAWLEFQYIDIILKLAGLNFSISI